MIAYGRNQKEKNLKPAENAKMILLLHIHFTTVLKNAKVCCNNYNTHLKSPANKEFQSYHTALDWKLEHKIFHEKLDEGMF